MIVNNVTRMLDARNIPYQAYELPVEKLSAIKAAEILGAPLTQVYKTIVVTRKGAGKPILAIVPGPNEVDLKALAKVLGEKKLSLPTERDAERVTGLQAGGISPLALLNQGFQMVLDDTAIDWDEIYLSGGQRGLNIRLPVLALIDLTNARVAAISREKN